MKKLYTLLVAALATFGAGAQSLQIFVAGKAVESGSKVDISNELKQEPGAALIDPEMTIKADKAGEVSATVTYIKGECTPERDEEWIKGGYMSLTWCGFTELCVPVPLNGELTKATNLAANKSEDMKLEFKIELGDEQSFDELAYSGECSVKFTFDGKDYEVTLVAEKASAGIGSIAADNNAPTLYFDLQGRRVENPSAGIYIVRKGNEVMKRVIK